MRIAHDAAHRARLYDSVEDIAQQALCSITRTINNGVVRGYTPGLIGAATKHAVAAALNARLGIRHEDYAARAKLDAEVSRTEQELGRRLTPAEVDGLANHVRDTWADPRHKPSAGFQNRFMEESADTAENRYLLENMADVEVELGDDHSTAADLAAAVESGELSVRQGRDRIWNALAREWGVPAAQYVSESRVRRARSAVTEAGGAATVARAYLDGDRTPLTSDLLLPWGGSSDAAHEKVAEFLVGRAALADQLWQSAIQSGTGQERRP